jgi:flagellar protein FliO/FliZ
MGTPLNSDFTMYYRVLGSLLLVLAVLALIAYGLKHWGRLFGQTNSNDQIQILTRLPLGPKHYLVLIQIQGQQWLLGVSPDGIRMLAPIDKPEGSQLQEPATPPENEPRPRFQSMLSKFIGSRP